MLDPRTYCLILILEISMLKYVQPVVVLHQSVNRALVIHIIIPSGGQCTPLVVVGKWESSSESLSWILDRTYSRITWVMVRMCSPSIMDERGIFTCSIQFLNEWDIQIESWPNLTTKGDLRSQNTLVPHWIWCEKLRGLNMKRWEQRVCRLGTWSFRARLGETMPCPHTRAPKDHYALQMIGSQERYK